MRRTPVVASLLAVFGLTACSDNLTTPLASSGPSTDAIHGDGGSEGQGAFHRYVAIGTSISMGVQSDGVYSATQLTSWPAQLARLAHNELSLPLISFPGCASPLKETLATGVRLSGESAALPFLSRACAPNEPGVHLPTGNVAIDGARTGQALTATPENPDPGHATQYPRVLPPGMSQVSAMESQNPKIVSVELGGNDILGARDGYYLPGVNVVPLSIWASQYHDVAARVHAATKYAVLLGLVNDVRSFPSFRTGAELWEARATFAPFNVAVSTDCMNSTNLLFVAVRVPVAVATGAAYARGGIGQYPLSCASAPSSTGITDYVLDENDIAKVNEQLAAMNAVIHHEAKTRGFAYFPLSVLYENVVTKPPFNAITFMTSTQPYGPYISLDGIHPSAEGARVIANAAANALNLTYHFNLPYSSGSATLLATH
jgi:lysophospholipase L1-like esterase